MRVIETSNSLMRATRLYESRNASNTERPMSPAHHVFTNKSKPISRRKKN